VGREEAEGRRSHTNDDEEDDTSQDIVPQGIVDMAAERLPEEVDRRLALSGLWLEDHHTFN
jgi:hypothetical protein